jgi:hypothetical protein
MRILRLFPLALIAVSARADLFTSADSGIAFCDNYGGPLSQVGTSHAVIDIPNCSYEAGLHASSIHAEAFAATGYLRAIVNFVGDGTTSPVSAIGSFDLNVGDTTSTALDLAFLITGNAHTATVEGSIKGTLSLSLDGAEFDDTFISFTEPGGRGGHITFFTFDNPVKFHITGLPAGIATVKLSVDGTTLEGVTGADITATQVPEPSSIVLLFSYLIAAGAPRIFRRTRQRQ